jgi:hypothetical protein
MLPLSRNTTYIPGSKVKSQDLNDLQDCIVGAKHGEIELNLSPFTFVTDGTWQVQSTVFFADDGYIRSNAAGRMVIPIPVREGQRLKSVVFARYGNAAANITSANVYRMTKGGVVTDLNVAPVSVAAAPAAWADTTVDVTDTVAADGDVFWLNVAASAANIRVGSTRATIDAP